MTLSKGTGIGTVCICPLTGRKIAKDVIHNTIFTTWDGCQLEFNVKDGEIEH